MGTIFLGSPHHPTTAINPASTIQYFIIPIYILPPPNP